MNKIVEQFEKAQMTRTLPEFSPGDTVVVNVKVKEGNRERVQAFEGIVIAKRNRGLHSAFTVRKISHGTGSSVCFRRTAPRSIRCRSSAAARCVAPSCTSCASWKARPRASRKTSPRATDSGLTGSCLRASARLRSMPVLPPARTRVVRVWSRARCASTRGAQPARRSGSCWKLPCT